jgi:hypothetical protein
MRRLQTKSYWRLSNRRGKDEDDEDRGMVYEHVVGVPTNENKTTCAVGANGKV